MTVWGAASALITFMFVFAPLAFNRATPPILGMPPLYFWFIFASATQPVIMGIVYLVDRKFGQGA